MQELAAEHGISWRPRVAEDSGERGSDCGCPARNGSECRIDDEPLAPRAVLLHGRTARDGITLRITSFESQSGESGHERLQLVVCQIGPSLQGKEALKLRQFSLH